MNRKEFIQKSVMASLRLWSLPFLCTGCEKDNIFKNSNFYGKILIIGAGVAGLYAGHLLKINGIEFEIIEASNRIGGRIGKIEGFADFTLDTGAEWLHGKNSILGNLVKENNVKMTEDDTEYSYWYMNKMVSSIPKNIFNQLEAKNLPDISFEELAIAEEFGLEYKYIVKGIAGDYGADASKLSAYWAYKEFENWSSGDTDYKFENTLFDLIEAHLAYALNDEIIFNSPILSIDYSENTVVLTSKSGEQFQGNQVIRTVPITILKQNYINFQPALPTTKTEAFQKTGMDAGMKVFLKFSEKFYPENILGGKFCAAYADEIIGKTGASHVLLAFIMGEQAEYLSGLPNDEALVKILLDELDEMFDGAASQSYERSIVVDWFKNPFIGGAYSYSNVNIGNARSLAAASIDGKVFFAGEAMNINGHHQTVHGAMETAENIIKEIANFKS